LALCSSEPRESRHGGNRRDERYEQFYSPTHGRSVQQRFPWCASFAERRFERAWPKASARA
jgi:hypothetical protein